MTLNVTYGNMTVVSPGFAVTRGVGSVPAARRLVLADSQMQSLARADASSIRAASVALRSIPLIAVEGEGEGVAYALDTPVDVATTPHCAASAGAADPDAKEAQAAPPRSARAVLLSVIAEGLFGSEPSRAGPVRRSTLARTDTAAGARLASGGVMVPLRRVEEALDLSLGLLLANGVPADGAARGHQHPSLAAVERFLAADDDARLSGSGPDGHGGAGDLLEARAVVRRGLQTSPTCGTALATASASGPVASVGSPVSVCPNSTLDATAVTLGLLASAMGDLSRLTAQMQAQQSSMLSLLTTLDDKFSARDAVRAVVC
jgi:hypothetical protein